MKKQKLYNDIIQECYEFLERMSSKYIDIIEKEGHYTGTYCKKDLYGNDRIIVTQVN